MFLTFHRCDMCGNPRILSEFLNLFSDTKPPVRKNISIACALIKFCCFASVTHEMEISVWLIWLKCFSLMLYNNSSLDTDNGMSVTQRTHTALETLEINVSSRQ